MGLDAVIRNAVALADKVTASLQVDVVHEPFDSVDSYNKPSYLDPVKRKAIVEHTTRVVHSIHGEELLATSKVTFLRNVVIRVRDRVTLPDGSIVFVQATRMVVDPITKNGYVPEAWVGRDDLSAGG